MLVDVRTLLVLCLRSHCLCCVCIISLFVCVCVRHVGDLGNIVQGADGAATVDIADSIVTLFGDNTVIGRSIVVGTIC